MGKPLRIGKGKPGPGRPKGVPNKFTLSAKEAFQLAFDRLGGAEGMVAWATSDPENLKTFYSLYSKLIPVDVQAKIEEITVKHKWGA